MTSSNGNIFRLTGPLCREFTCHRWIPSTKASFDVLFDLRLNKRLSKQWGGWFETLLRPLWLNCNECYLLRHWQLISSRKMSLSVQWMTNKCHHKTSKLRDYGPVGRLRKVHDDVTGGYIPRKGSMMWIFGDFVVVNLGICSTKRRIFGDLRRHDSHVV